MASYSPWRLSQMPQALQSVPMGKLSFHQRGVSLVPQCAHTSSLPSACKAQLAVETFTTSSVQQSVSALGAGIKIAWVLMSW